MLAHHYDARLAELSDALEGILPDFAARYTELHQGASWIEQIKAILAADASSTEVAQSLRAYLDDLLARPDRLPFLCEFSFTWILSAETTGTAFSIAMNLTLFPVLTMLSKAVFVISDIACCALSVRKGACAAPCFVWALEIPLVEQALRMAALRCRQPGGGLLHYSDRGSQYASKDYRVLLAARGITVSMSRTGDCYDNVVMESFFGTLKTECATERYPTRADARTDIFEFIEVWYNRRRRHSTLGYLCPHDFEAAYSLDRV